MNNRSFICDKWAKRWYQIWGNPQVVLIQPKLKIGKLKLLRQNCCILPNSAKLSAARSLLPSCNFSATKRSTCSSYCLGAVPPPQKKWRLKIYVKTRKFPSSAELHTIVLSRRFTDCIIIRRAIATQSRPPFGGRRSTLSGNRTADNCNPSSLV